MKKSPLPDAPAAPGFDSIDRELWRRRAAEIIGTHYQNYSYAVSQYLDRVAAAGFAGESPAGALVPRFPNGDSQIPTSILRTIQAEAEAFFSRPAICSRCETLVVVGRLFCPAHTPAPERLIGDTAPDTAEAARTLYRQARAADAEAPSVATRAAVARAQDHLAGFFLARGGACASVRLGAGR